MLFVLLSLLQSEIGFGKLETYIKLDKLGEVREPVWSPPAPQHLTNILLDVGVIYTELV